MIKKPFRRTGRQWLVDPLIQKWRIKDANCLIPETSQDVTVSLVSGAYCMGSKSLLSTTHPLHILDPNAHLLYSIFSAQMGYPWNMYQSQITSPSTHRPQWLLGFGLSTLGTWTHLWKILKAVGFLRAQVADLPKKNMANAMESTYFLKEVIGTLWDGMCVHFDWCLFSGLAFQRNRKAMSSSKDFAKGMRKSRLHEGTFHSWQSPRHCKELEAVLWPKLIAIRSLEMTMSLHLSTKNFFTTQQGTVTSESCIWELLGTWPTGAEISKNPMKSTSSIRTISVWARIQLSQVPRKSLSIACHMRPNECHEVQGSILRFQTISSSPETRPPVNSFSCRLWRVRPLWSMQKATNL